MISAERIGQIYTDRSIPEFSQFLFANACREVIEDTGPLTLDQKTQFVKNYVALIGNKRSYNGHTFSSGSIGGKDKDGKSWSISSSFQKEQPNQHILFKDSDISRALRLDEEEHTTIEFFPHEEGIWAWSEQLDDQEARKWLEIALDVYEKKFSDERVLRYKREKHNQDWQLHPKRMIDEIYGGPSVDLKREL